MGQMYTVSRSLTSVGCTAVNVGFVRYGTASSGLVIFYTHRGSENPDHPDPSDYENGGYTVCAEGHSTWRHFAFEFFIFRDLL